MNLLSVLGVLLLAFLLVGTGLAIGLLFGRKPIGGSCGGIASVTGEDGETKCSLCQSPSEACQDLRKRMEQSSAATGAEQSNETAIS